MKSLSLALLASLMVLVFSTHTYAAKKEKRKVAQIEIECSKTLQGVISQIDNTPGCYEAIAVVKKCSKGQSSDSDLGFAAEKACDKKDFKSMTKSDVTLKSNMATRCDTLCDPQTDGTECYSNIVLCRLKTLEFFAQFYSAGY